MRKIVLSLAVLAASGAYVWSQARPGGRPPESIDLSSLADPGTAPSAALTPPLATLAPQPAVVVEPGIPAVASLRRHDEDEGDALPPLPAPVPGPLTTASLAQPTEPVPPLPVAPAEVALAPTPPDPLPAADAPPSPDVVMTDVPMPRLRPTPAAASTASPAATSTAAPASASRFVGAFLNVATNAPPASIAYRDGTYNGPAVDAYYGLVRVQAIVQGGKLAAIKILDYPSDRRTSVYINSQALPMLRDEVIYAQTANVDIISGATLTSEAFIRSLGAALAKAGA